jgi:D-sedoheptulose 7-phosphate isomerase
MTSHPLPFPRARQGTSPACHDEVCVTCADTAVPVRITELRPGGLALADTGAGAEEISVALVEARVGDVVLVHAKEAIAVLAAGDAPPQPAAETGGRADMLYPFLRPGDGGIDGVVEEVTRSTAEKARETAALRREVLGELGPRLVACADDLAAAFGGGGRLFTFGNGGSSTDAQATAQLFLAPGPGGRGLPAVSLTGDAALLTALGNDVGFEVIFARQLAALGAPGDVAMAMSTSGGSVNVLRGLEAARRRGMLTVGFAGSGGGRMAEAGVVDHLFVIPSSSVHRVQEAQATVCHVLWDLVQRALPPAT